MRLLDKEAALSGCLELTNRGPMLFLEGEGNKPHCGLGLRRGQPARLVLTDEAGKVVWKAP